MKPGSQTTQKEQFWQLEWREKLAGKKFVTGWV